MMIHRWNMFMSIHSPTLFLFRQNRTKTQRAAEGRENSSISRRGEVKKKMKNVKMLVVFNESQIIRNDQTK